jgi:hypothetical protein
MMKKKRFLIWLHPKTGMLEALKLSARKEAAVISLTDPEHAKVASWARVKFKMPLLPSPQPSESEVGSSKPYSPNLNPGSDFVLPEPQFEFDTGFELKEFDEFEWC